ncbi:hypothetical protein TcasGA2_TC013852 [Tribolium castaneum]|uniref:Uncharacterized protein n=1 Tax=Tribolium castaneum TaxID=7070 RepID=D6WNQ8_TRICA|nr:hypothetical protein TcasGA2_TC013852 [Tribolium castaneum]
MLEINEFIRNFRQGTSLLNRINPQQDTFGPFSLLIPSENNIIKLIDPYFQQDSFPVNQSVLAQSIFPLQGSDRSLSKQIDAVGTVTYIMHAGSGRVSGPRILPVAIVTVRVRFSGFRSNELFVVY